MHSTWFSHKSIKHGLALVCACTALVSTPLCAKEANAPASEATPTIDSALNTLFGETSPGLVRSVTARAQGGGVQTTLPDDKASMPLRVVVKPGDTVDALLRRHMGESAFSQKFLREAAIRLNPAVFAKGNIHRLESGSTLLLPSEQTLVGLLLQKSSGAVSIPLGSGSESPAAQAPATASGPSTGMHTQKNWVRYP